jgi:[acyl-carrier-protein] S-malonyltransferase
MALGIVFSGQGNQYSKMFAKFNLDDIKMLSDFLKIDLVPKITLNEQELFNNLHAQPLIAGFEYLIWNSIKNNLPEISGISGYSLGELTAVAVSSNMSLTDLLKTAKTRAALMTDALSSPGSLIAISGADINAVTQICNDSKCFIAIKNSDTSLIVGGLINDLQIFKELASKLPGNIKIQNIAVDIPAHTPLLKNASRQFHQYLSTNIQNNNLEFKIVSGIDASVQYSMLTTVDNLSKQISQTINFDKVIQVLYELGSDVILEIGPGKALSNIIKQQDLPIKVHSIDEFNSLQECIHWLKNAINLN